MGGNALELAPKLTQLHTDFARSFASPEAQARVKFFALDDVAPVVETSGVGIMAQRGAGGYSMKETADSDIRLSFVYRRVMVRSPNEGEQRVLHKVLQQQLEVYRNDPEAAKKVIAIGQAPRDETLNPAEHAAWSSLCLALFNLDETLTRE